MEDADSDSGFDSDGNRYHAGRDELYGLRTNSHAVGPTENRKGRHPDGGDASLLCPFCRCVHFSGTACLAPCDTEDRIESNLSKTKNIPPKAVIFSDFCCTFAIDNFCLS